MTGQVEITEAMIKAAMEVGTRSGALSAKARYSDVRRMLAAVVAEMAPQDRGPAYPLRVRTGIEVKKARFIGVFEARAYYRVETEDGKQLVVHANDIEPSRGTR